MKNVILDIKISVLIIGIVLILVSCDRDDPVGGDFIDDIVGDVVCDSLVSFTHTYFQENSITGSSDYIYTGDNVISLLSFERPQTKVQYDSVILEFVVNSRVDGELYLKRFDGEFEEDSIINWEYVSSHLSDIISESYSWIEDTLTGDTLLRISANKVLDDSLINVALCGEGEGCAFYSKDSHFTPIIKLYRGPLLEIEEPIRDIFVDTILNLDTMDIFIASGFYEYKDSIFISDSIINFDNVATVNNADLYITVISTFGPNPKISIRYKGSQSAGYKIEEDSIVKIEITGFVNEWITDEDRFLIIEGKEGTHFRASFSRDIMLEVVYTNKTGDMR